MYPKEDGKVSQDEAVEKVSPEAPQPGSAAPEAAIEPPVMGFIDGGYFVFKAHSSLGYHALQGHLLEAQVYLRSLMLAAQRKEQESKLVKPGGGFLGRFKAFK